MKKMKKPLSLILAGAGVLFLLGAIFVIGRQLYDDRQARDTISELKASAETPTPEAPVLTPAASATASPAPTASPSPEPTPVLTANPYADSFLENEDMVAWLCIPDTPIDYPVMWTPADENYYLLRGFDGSSNSNGCLILDTDSCVDPLTTNLIIHGHNMKSGAMFGTLSDYEKEEFYQDHKTIQLFTEQCLRNYEVIAVFRSQVFKKSDTVFKFYNFFQAATEDEFNDFYSNIKEMSIYDTGVTAEFGDHFLTLSTCSYHVDRGRFVVVAKETESGSDYLPPGSENSGTETDAALPHQ